MIKRAPTAPVLAVIAAFALSCFGLLLYLWLSFGGPIPLKPGGYRFQVRFPEAVQLASQADVRIAGVNVGKVVSVAPDPADNRTRATIQMQSQFAPVPRDTRAMLRLKSLLGETYVELTPGHRSRGLLREGGMLPDGQVSHTVELDEILRTFEPSTRAAFRTWMQAQAAALRGRGADVNAAFGSLPQFVDASSRLLGTLDSQSAAVRRLVSGTGAFFAAISARRGELRGLVTDADRLFETTARRNRDLAAILQALPSFERQSRLTLPRLTAFGRGATPVIRQLGPAADAMTPAFQALERLAPDLRSVLGRLGPVVTASRAGLPAFEQLLREVPPLLADFQPFLRDANPMVRYIGANKHEVTAFFANTTAATLARDLTLPRTADGIHYLRTSQTLGPESLAFLPRPLGSTRQNAYMAPGAMGELLRGLPTLDPATCANGDPAPPADSFPPSLAALVRVYAFRTPDGSGAAVARPPCRAQGAYPAFTTAFPQLRADPATSASAR